MAVAKLVVIVFVYETRFCNPLCSSCGSESAPHLLVYSSCVAKEICKLLDFLLFLSEAMEKIIPCHSWNTERPNLCAIECEYSI